MGKNLIQQKRGKGGPRYRSPGFKYAGKASYRQPSEKITSGKILDIIKCSGHTAPLIKVKYDNGETSLMIAPEGVKVGDGIKVGSGKDIGPGNIASLKDLPEGTLVYNIENTPGDGGKVARSSGMFARIVYKSKKKIMVKLPSHKQKEFNPECRATIGTIAGSGRLEKPFLKAGKKYYAMKARNKLWPITSATSMNSLSHPFGGTKSSHKGKPTQSSRNSPPGRKVGKIAPKRTGRKNR